MREWHRATAGATVEVARIYPASEENISFLSDRLLGGEIVAVPTETVYGLAANAFDDRACAEVFRAKARPAFDPLIVHLPPGYSIEELAEVSPLLPLLSKAFWPGPLTLVLRKKPKVPDIVTAGLDSVAVRIPRHPVLQRLLEACRLPLAAPSANPFGYVSPTRPEHVEAGLGSQISHILDGGPCAVGVESTILDIREPARPILLRPGGIPREELARTLGMKIHDSEAGAGSEVMPGQLKKHYSPRSPCQLRERLSSSEAIRNPARAYLFFQRPPLSGRMPSNIFWLSTDGDDVEAARNLFAALRRIDELDFPDLLVEKAPDTGLGSAINDRLRRAAAQESGDGEPA